MRLKNIPKAKEIVPNHPLVITNPSEFKGAWNQAFHKPQPLFLEIGCGKGQFINKLSEINPFNNYIGIEQYESVLYLALEKSDINNPQNLKFLCVHAELLLDFFSENEVDGIYLNFSDPWPKKRHAKRRLTSHRFLPIYHKLLKPGGIIEMKTDNTELYQYSLETIHENSDFEILYNTDDLYNDSKMLWGNIPTEYEEKFTGMGQPINKIIFINK